MGMGELAVGIQLWSDNEPFATATFSLGNDSGCCTLVRPFRAWVDTNNNPEMEIFLTEHGFGKPCVRFGEPVLGMSGYCIYPYWEFDADRLKELDPDGCIRYADAYGKRAEKTLKKIYGR